MLLCDEADDEENWSDAAPSSIEGAASGAEVRDKRGSAASSGAGGGSGVAEGNSIGKRNSNNRSRRLLSLEQSKVLYKILDKVSLNRVTEGNLLLMARLAVFKCSHLIARTMKVKWMTSSQHALSAKSPTDSSS